MPSEPSAGESLDSLVRTVLDEDTDSVFVFNPTKAVVELFVDTLYAREESDSEEAVRILARAGVYHDLFDSYLMAAKAAEAVEDGRLELREFDEPYTFSMAITEEDLYILVVDDEAGVWLEESPVDELDGIRDRIEGQWSGAKERVIRTPGYGRMKERLEESFDEGVRKDFETAVEHLHSGDYDEPSEQHALLIAGARNEVMNYHLGRCAEDMRLVSAATVSRAKNEIEDAGIIETTKERGGIGAPRHRLHLTADCDSLSVEGVLERYSEAHQE